MSLESSQGPTTGAPKSRLRDDSTASKQDTGVIGSLGDALAGVTLGSSSSNNNAFGFHDDRGDPSGNPFNSSAQSHHHHPPPNNSGWGSFSNPDTSRNSFARPTPGNNNKGRQDQKTSQPPPTPDQMERKQSIDLFLSRSPSEVLGNDVFKELSTGNLPSLAIAEDPEHVSTENSATSGSGNFSNNFRGTGGQSSVLHPSVAAGSGQSAFPEQRRGSTSSNVTGTTASNTTGSRSNSPYESGSNNHSGRTIKAYENYDQNKNDISVTTSAAVYQPMTPGPSANSTSSMSPRQQSSFNTSRNNNVGLGQQYNPTTPDKHVHTTATPTNNSLPPHQPQQQILYMAVPTPDGRQVLQPVQMVQMPGKPYAYVLPGAEGISAMQGGIQGIQSGAQPMMMMPTMLPHQGQLSSPVGVPSRQQPGIQIHQQNETMNGVIGMNGGGGRNSLHQNKTMVGGGYHSSPNDLNSPGFGSVLAAGLRSEDYGSMQAQGNIESGDPQYLNQPTDPALTSLYSTPQRPPLDALLGQVRRLSRDQVGCRLVQQALDEEGPMAATLILNEGLPFWGEAMVDPFGNYLFQKILEKITPEERIMLVKTVSTRLVNASLNLHGTRSVQKIVELCTIDEENSKLTGEIDGGNKEETASDVLTKALSPAAARLCIDSHGNHVIQRILLKLGHKHSKFVFDAVAESVGDVARHRHGCCVIQRCLDSPPGPARSNLVCRIVDKSLELMQDAYGNYVVQYVLDVCSDDDVHAVCESVIGKVNLLAIQKFSSNVMEKCLERCSDRVKEHYMQELSDPERIRELMMDPFGNYVVQRALSVATHTQAVRLVEAMRPHLIAQSPGTPTGQRNGGVRNTAGGRRIMAKICRRFPNFNLNTTVTREELYSQNRSRHHHNNHHHQSTTVVPPMYGTIPQLSSPQIQVLQQQSQPQQQQPQQPLYTTSQNLAEYNTTPLAINPLNMGGLQFDQRQTYYDPSADANYFQQQQHQQHNNHFGQGAYPSGL
mmetsp:Transcript_14713/g.34157  ORF Transcript_14713/g.34157 Transcript_14713/m.34157 type:complete len:997 (-) Transcript_14713:2373-5363(-)|eukprot:CAMPEP_0197194752 /NCGR_PEP_ID=MMETSP1423-20130617/29798_1 /TAXON_ID=476441 /ORGANISM="Pseudo-nitzschia heimii, Strain UNC1101" /LENGTH=996 /DNA_ID=CAMNT_0042648223 /DNA_START=228 /DNA_END=3218 /DNA_ORIENTATION=+